ncbi:hypothetical protein V493_01622 [Pseudogymnoascus sp. VKM F-4281 (FW-2241)]|nr:hypothetical protein V493_01622 [Pseudogymnoascus sp. VKM F-4281 (FW-2241)]
MATVRICVCGDEGTGKSSLITSLVKDIFVTNKIQSVLPHITIPPSIGTPENVTTTIVDTSALPQERNTLRKEIRKSNVILLVYSDHYSYERVALFWMPYFRSLGVNVPVVLCANKSDITANGTTAQVVEDEMLPVMAEFKEIDSCIRTSAREHHNVNEVFFLCQKAVTHPIAPLFDSKEGVLKPSAVAALRRIFYLCDKDQDGYLNDQEMHAFQAKCFQKPLSPDDLENIKQSIIRGSERSTVDQGIDIDGFIHLNKIFAEKGRHETIWIILRTFQYTDSLSLKDSFLNPKFDVPEYASAELSPAGYRFFVDLFLVFDKDNDGGLNNDELAALFAPTPGLPQSWNDSSFPSSTVRNDAGLVTLQGWLAQWSMTTFVEPKTTLSYLAYLGFEPASPRETTTAALKVTKPRKRRRRPGRVERNVMLCYVLGAPASGKSSLLDAFLNRPFDSLYHPTIKPRTAVNSVELQGGKQCYLILEELGELEPAILENTSKLEACDLICYTYDSSDPDSFSHIVNLRKKYPHLDDLPNIYVALKADLDKTTQRSEQQPDQYTVGLMMNAPLHVSVTWHSISELFVTLAEAAINPSIAFPKSEEEPPDRTGLLHDNTFLELRDVHPISILWLLLVKPFPLVSPHTSASKASRTYTTPPAVLAAQALKMATVMNLDAQHPRHLGPRGTTNLNGLRLITTMKQRPHTYNNQGGYLPNGATAGHTGLPQGAAPLLPNHGRVIQTGGVRVLCVADVRGNLRSLNELAKQARADHIIHTGDFGFYDETSLDRIADKTLKHVAQYSPLISEPIKKAIQQPGQSGPVKSRFPASDLPLSELPSFLNGSLKLDVPVYTVWGACEDVRVLEKFRSGEYKVDKLHIIDEARSMLLEVGGVKLRLLGLGGAVVMHKLFDNGEGRTTIAGGQGTMWTTLLQMGELVDTANRVYDPTETRVFITHASPAREGILNQLSVTLKADFSISAGLHFRYGSSYNEFSVNPTLDHYRGKLAASKASFNDVWETVKGEVQPAIQQNEAQQNLLNNALGIVEKMPTTAHGGNPFGGPVGGSNATAIGQVDESAFKNMWNFNLADAAFGWLVLEIQDGRIGTEMRAQGFNFAHRGAKQHPAQVNQQQPAQAPATGSGTPGASHALASAPSGPAQTRSPAGPAASQPFNAPQQRATSQQQQPRGPASNPPRATGSPAPFQGQKPATPQPAQNVVNLPAASKENEKAPAAGANGSANNGAGDAAASPAQKSQDIIGLFVMNVQTDDAVRDLFVEEDKAKIVKIDKWGQSNKVVQFKTAEERDDALARLSDDVKTRSMEDRSRPLVKIFLAKDSRATYPSNRGGAGNWGSSRGGSNPNAPQAGYRSAGGASDSESGRGGRGRGGARGGRGSTERGGRARGGRGSFKGDGNTSPTTSAPAAPATSTAPTS